MQITVKGDKITYICSCGMSYDATIIGDPKQCRISMEHPCSGCKKQLSLRVEDEAKIMSEGMRTSW